MLLTGWKWIYYPNVTEYCFFLAIILFALWIYLHWTLYQEYSNIRNLNNLFVLIELFPTPDLLDWRIPIYIYIYIYVYIYMCAHITLIYIYICTHITHAYKYIYIYMLHKYTCIYIHMTHAHTHTHIYIYTYV